MTRPVAVVKSRMVDTQDQREPTSVLIVAGVSSSSSTREPSWLPGGAGCVATPRRTYCDSVTGERLEEKQAQEGIRAELQDLADSGVFVPATRQQAVDVGKPIVGTCWVLRNKGDKVEARVATQEPSSGESQDLFTAASGILATRLVLWWCLRSRLCVRDS